MSRQRLPPKAAIAPQLLAKLTALNLSSAQLLEDFLEWKSSGEEDSSYFFARDGLNRGSKHLSHAHILPTVSEDKAAWDFAYERFRKRTSDRYLFYVDGGLSYGYLLLDNLLKPLRIPTSLGQQSSKSFLADYFGWMWSLHKGIVPSGTLFSESGTVLVYVRGDKLLPPLDLRAIRAIA